MLMNFNQLKNIIIRKYLKIYCASKEHRKAPSVYAKTLIIQSEINERPMIWE